MIEENIQRGRGGSLTSGKWGPLLDLISSVESAGGSYDSRYGGIYPGYSKLTIAQADAVQRSNYKKWGSAASGKYQFMNIAGQAAYAGLKPTDLFSPENLDKMAMPVILEIKTKSGKVNRLNLPVEVWERNSRFTFNYPSTEEIVSIVSDPDKVFPDSNPENNTWPATN